jgi:hypothetical protein
VGEVMLDLDNLEPVPGRQGLTHQGRAVVRVPVQGNGDGLVLEELLVEVDGPLELIGGAGILQIAQVLGQDGLARAQETDGVLEFTPQGQDGGGGLKAGWQGNGRRSQAPRPPQWPGRPIHDPYHRIVHPVKDVAVVKQERIRQARQALAGLGVIDALGLLAAVAAGHDQGPIPILEQEMVQGAVGEHETEGGLAWSDLGRYQGCHLRRP